MIPPYDVQNEFSDVLNPDEEFFQATKRARETDQETPELESNTGVTVPIFSQEYSIYDQNFINSVIQTTDGGYALAGNTRDSTVNNFDFLVVKTDPDGQQDWIHNYGGENLEYADSIIQTDDGGFLIAGTKALPGFTDADIWLVKTDGSGVEMWSQSISSPPTDGTMVEVAGTGSRCLIQTSDGGYAIAGWRRLPEETQRRNGWIVKVDSAGIVQWTRQIGDRISGYFASLVQTSDDGYLIAGMTSPSIDSDFLDGWLVKLDANGIEEWSKTYTDGEVNYFFSIIHTNDSGFALAGATGSYTGTPTNLLHGWLVKVDSTGAEQWRQSYPDTRSIMEAIQTTDGGFALDGFDNWLIKTDDVGTPQWKKNFTTDRSGQLFSLCQTSDGGYVMAGGIKSTTENKSNAWLLKSQ